MTFEETKELLKNLRIKKKKVDIFRRRYEHCLADAKMLSDNVAVVKRAEIASDEFEETFLEYMTLEDKIAEALPSLTDEEQGVIVEAYLNGTPEWRIGQRLYMSERTVSRRKNSAIKKIGEQL